MSRKTGRWKICVFAKSQKVLVFLPPKSWITKFSANNNHQLEPIPGNRANSLPLDWQIHPKILYNLPKFCIIYCIMNWQNHINKMSRFSITFLIWMHVLSPHLDNYRQHLFTCFSVLTSICSSVLTLAGSALCSGIDIIKYLSLRKMNISSRSFRPGLQEKRPSFPEANVKNHKHGFCISTNNISHETCFCLSNISQLRFTTASWP